MYIWLELLWNTIKLPEKDKLQMIEIMIEKLVFTALYYTAVLKTNFREICSQISEEELRNSSKSHIYSYGPIVEIQIKGLIRGKGYPM